MQTLCIHQLSRPSTETRMGMNENGRGDCFTCTPDPHNNPNCSHYHMIVMGTMCEIEEAYFKPSCVECQHGDGTTYPVLKTDDRDWGEGCWECDRDTKSQFLKKEGR